MTAARRLEALRAMAHADESPNERDIARAKLAEAGIPVDPPRPPAPPASPAPQPMGWNHSSTTATTSPGTWAAGWILIRVVRT